jgi:opacity protein-like surface antigen
MPNAIDGQKLELLPYEIGPYADTFTDQTGGNSVTWGVDAKYRFRLHEPASKHYIVDSIGVGADIFQITSLNQTGNVLQFGMPEFENFKYTLNLQSTRFMADFDLDFHPIAKRFIPFIEAGLGAAVTTVGYQSKPIPPLAGPNFELVDETSWTFAYQAGAGIKYVVNTHLILSLHYLYANMGKVDTSTNGDLSTLAKPMTVDLSSQNLLFGLTFAQ